MVSRTVAKVVRGIRSSNRFLFIALITAVVVWIGIREDVHEVVGHRHREQQRQLEDLLSDVLRQQGEGGAERLGKEHADQKEHEKPRSVGDIPVVKKMNESEMVDELAQALPNIPVYFLEESKETNWLRRKNLSCGRIPHLLELHVDNDHWQQVETTNGTVYLYRAYLDRREAEPLGPTIRIISMIDRLEPQMDLTCQIWLHDEYDPIFSPVVEYKFAWLGAYGNYKQGVLQPYLLTCPLPEVVGQRVPVAVSLVTNKCDRAFNMLKVYYNRPEKPNQGFAVCVKGMSFPFDDLTVKLVEWIELLHLLGASQIFLYEMTVHPNVSRMLRYYADRNMIDLTQFSLPGPQPNNAVFRHLYLKKKVIHKRQNELIPYDDCLYRNLDTYDALALLDIDEIIMPKKYLDWGQTLKELREKSMAERNATRTSYCFRNVYFMDDMLMAEHHSHFEDIPHYMHMLQHVYRSQEYSRPGFYVKCLHDPRRVKTLHNHFPFSCIKGCSSENVDLELGHLQHYRKDCVGDLKSVCEEKYRNRTEMDTAIWRYKDELIARVQRTLSDLGYEV